MAGSRVLNVKRIRTEEHPGKALQTVFVMAHNVAVAEHGRPVNWPAATGYWRMPQVNTAPEERTAVVVRTESAEALPVEVAQLGAVGARSGDEVGSQIHYSRRCDLSPVKTSTLGVRRHKQEDEENHAANG